MGRRYRIEVMHDGTWTQEVLGDEHAYSYSSWEEAEKAIRRTRACYGTPEEREAEFRVVEIRDAGEERS